MYLADPKQRGFPNDHFRLFEAHNYALPLPVISLGAG